jgi:hypothetical protein
MPTFYCRGKIPHFRGIGEQQRTPLSNFHLVELALRAVRFENMTITF